MQDPEPSDGGQYKCTASNESGESNANLALNFEGICVVLGIVWLEMSFIGINVCYKAFIMICCVFTSTCIQVPAFKCPQLLCFNKSKSY